MGITDIPNRLADNDLLKDLYSLFARVIVGFFSFLEIGYLLFNNFRINETLINSLLHFNFNFMYSFLFIMFLFILGVITLYFNNLFFTTLAAFIRLPIFNKKFGDLIFGKRAYYAEPGKTLDLHSQKVLNTVGNYFELGNLVGEEFYRLCRDLSIKHAKVLKIHKLAFDDALLKGFFINFLLLFIISFGKVPIFISVLILLLYFESYREIRSYLINLDISIYDAAYYLIIKENKGKKENSD